MKIVRSKSRILWIFFFFVFLFNVLYTFTQTISYACLRLMYTWENLLSTLLFVFLVLSFEVKDDIDVLSSTYEYFTYMDE